MYTAVFYTKEMVTKSYGVDVEKVRHEEATGQTDLGEAFDVAVAKGADPMEYIQLIWKEA